MITQNVLEYSEPGVRGSVIVGVKIIGTKSTNGRTYPLPVLQEAIPLYEDAPVYLAHPDAREKRQGSRQHKDHFGSLHRVAGNGNGLYADLRVKRSHPQAKGILADAATGKFGLSHNAVVKMTDDDKTVTEILEVNSVDLVNNPATTKNLFEGNPMPEDPNTAPTAVPIEPLPTFETKMLGFMAEIKAEIAKGMRVPAAVLENKPADPAPVKRLTALETREVEEGEEPAIGNTHEDFLAHLRGFSLTNTKGAQR